MSKLLVPQRKLIRPTRRGLIAGAVALLAMPAIVRAQSLPLLGSGSTPPSGGGPVAAAWDPANAGPNITVGGTGNRTASMTVGGANWNSVFVVSGASKTSGLLYAECLIAATTVNSTLWQFGICKNNQNVNSFITSTGDACFARGANGISPGGGSGIFTWNATNEPGGGYNTTGQNDTIALAINFSTGKIWLGFAVSGAGSITWGGADPSTGTNPVCTFTAPGAPLYLGWGANEGGGSQAGTLRAASGDQTFSPPAGFTAWG